jgi:hypothetical protein
MKALIFTAFKSCVNMWFLVIVGGFQAMSHHATFLFGGDDCCGFVMLFKPRGGEVLVGWCCLIFLQFGALQSNVVRGLICKCFVGSLVWSESVHL